MEFYVICDSGPAAIKAAEGDPRIRYGAMLWNGQGFIAGTADDLTNLPAGRLLIGQERAFFFFPYKVKRLEPTGREHFALVGWDRLDAIREEVLAATDCGQYVLVETDHPLEGSLEWEGIVASWRTSTVVTTEVEAFRSEMERDA